MSRMKERPRARLVLAVILAFAAHEVFLLARLGKHLGEGALERAVAVRQMQTQTAGLPSSVFCHSPAALGSAAAAMLVATASAAAAVVRTARKFDREIRMTLTVVWAR